MTDYDNNNIFAKILRGEISCHKVYEDENALAFMDIMPRCDGHVLVIPKAPARNILDITPADLQSLILATQKVAKGVKLALGAEGITLQQFSETAGGQVVFHLHFHILPRFHDVKLKPHTSEMENPKKLKTNAQKIRAVLMLS